MMSTADAPLKDIVDADTHEVWQVLRNSVRSPGSVFDRAAQAIERLARERHHLLELTAALEEHPEDYNGECWCAGCRAAAAASGDLVPPRAMA